MLSVKYAVQRHEQPISPAFKQKSNCSVTYHGYSCASFSLFLSKNRLIWHNRHRLVQMLSVCVHAPFPPSSRNWQTVCPIAAQNKSYVSHLWPMIMELQSSERCWWSGKLRRQIRRHAISAIKNQVPYFKGNTWYYLRAVTHNRDMFNLFQKIGYKLGLY